MLSLEKRAGPVSGSREERADLLLGRSPIRPNFLGSLARPGAPLRYFKIRHTAFQLGVLGECMN